MAVHARSLGLHCIAFCAKNALLTLLNNVGTLCRASFIWLVSLKHSQKNIDPVLMVNNCTGSFRVGLNWKGLIIVEPFDVCSWFSKKHDLVSIRTPQVLRLDYLRAFLAHISKVFAAVFRVLTYQAYLPEN